MIVKMRKLNLVALSSDRDALLNALRRTGAVEIKARAQEEGLSPFSADGEEIRSRLASLETALEIVESAAAASPSKDKGSAPAKDGFEVSLEELSAAAASAEECEKTVAKINSLADKKSACNAEEARLIRAIDGAAPYARLDVPFSAFKNTAHTTTRLGIIPASTADGLGGLLDGLELVGYDFTVAGENAVCAVTAHNSVAEQADAYLASAGFRQCEYCGDFSGKEQYERLSAELENVRAAREKAAEELAALAPSVRKLKVYCDYMAFELEKIEESGKTCRTEKTLFLEAFVPENGENRVKSELDSCGLALFYEFSDPAEGEETPTLLKNNTVVSNFETLTNMYSPPSSREFDPNTIMALFYSLFLGFIMGDVGYGLLMILGGGFIYFRAKKGSGIKNLAGVFATGGIFAEVWGVLFNSVFGVPFLPFNILPVVITSEYGFDVFTIMGIELPAILVIALFIGILQIFAGYICRTVQEWRRGNIFDGICDGVSWAVFSLGVAIAVSGMIEEFALPSAVTLAGGIIAGAALLFAAVTAGRKEKLAGKFTKGFGSLYGVINYVSDILSYARLYGLMLSGAVIAQIVSKYAIQFIETSVPLAILGVVLMVVGHVFNFAMGLLGAYIHDARLQYVEFYGRFYEGDGELFTPLGSRTRHVRIIS